jgi:hypothetical protein
MRVAIGKRFGFFEIGGHAHTDLGEILLHATDRDRSRPMLALRKHNIFVTNHIVDTHSRLFSSISDLDPLSWAVSMRAHESVADGVTERAPMFGSAKYLPDGRVLAPGMFGKIYERLPNGVWRSYDTGIAMNIVDVAYHDSGKYAAISDLNVIAFSESLAGPWEIEQISSGPRSLKAVFFLADGRLALVSQERWIQSAHQPKERARLIRNWTVGVRVLDENGGWELKKRIDDASTSSRVLDGRDYIFLSTQAVMKGELIAINKKDLSRSVRGKGGSLVSISADGLLTAYSGPAWSPRQSDRQYVSIDNGVSWARTETMDVGNANARLSSYPMLMSSGRVVSMGQLFSDDQPPALAMFLSSLDGEHWSRDWVLEWPCQHFADIFWTQDGVWCICVEGTLWHVSATDSDWTLELRTN